MPPGITNLTATPGDGAVTLSWTLTGNATLVEIYRNGAFAWETETSWTDTGLTNGQEYTYQLEAHNASYTEYAAPVIIKATPQSSQPPPGITDLTAVPGNGQVALSWTLTGDATLVEIYRDGVFAWETETAWTDTGLTNGQEYTYRLEPHNADYSRYGTTQIIKATPVSDAIRWDGRDWYIRAVNNAPPGGNDFSRSCVTVDGDLLRLKIRSNGSDWLCAEVFAGFELPGYGRYSWVWDSPRPPGTWHVNVVLGMFLYSATQQNGVDPEIDWEVAQFGTPGDPRLWSSVHPASIPATSEGQGFWSTDGPYESLFIWQPGQVYFRTVDAVGRVLGEHVVIEQVPVPGDELVRMNLWLHNRQAPDAEHEVHFHRFTFLAGATWDIPKAETQRETFDDPHGWALYSPAEIVAGEMVLPVTQDYSAEARTGAVYDLRDSSVVAEFSELPTAASSEVYFEVRYDADDALALILSQDPPTLLWRATNSGTSLSPGKVAFPAGHRFWRISHAVGRVHFATSADGFSWITHASVAGMDEAKLGRMQVRLRTGHWADESNPGIARVAGLSLLRRRAVKVFDGTSWVPRPVRHFSGTWLAAPVRVGGG